jgi:hypothetical protein
MDSIRRGYDYPSPRQEIKPDVDRAPAVCGRAASLYHAVSWIQGLFLNFCAAALFFLSIGTFVTWANQIIRVKIMIRMGCALICDICLFDK